MGFCAYTSGGVLLRGRRSYLGESSIFIYSRRHFHRRRARRVWNEIAIAVHGVAFFSNRLSLTTWTAYRSVSETYGS